MSRIYKIVEIVRNFYDRDPHGADKLEKALNEGYVIDRVDVMNSSNTGSSTTYVLSKEVKL